MIFIDDFFRFPLKSYDFTLKTYDPDKYDLTPKESYRKQLIEEADKSIAYHENKIAELRKQKEELQKQE